MSVDYAEFIAAKAYSHIDAGFSVGRGETATMSAISARCNWT